MLSLQNFTCLTILVLTSCGQSSHPMSQKDVRQAATAKYYFLRTDTVIDTIVEGACQENVTPNRSNCGLESEGVLYDSVKAMYNDNLKEDLRANEARIAEETEVERAKIPAIIEARSKVSAMETKVKETTDQLNVAKVNFDTQKQKADSAKQILVGIDAEIATVDKKLADQSLSPEMRNALTQRRSELMTSRVPAATSLDAEIANLVTIEKDVTRLTTILDVAKSRLQTAQSNLNHLLATTPITSLSIEQLRGEKATLLEYTDGVDKLKEYLALDGIVFNSDSLPNDVQKCWARFIKAFNMAKSPTSKIGKIATGYGHTCVIDTEGVKCWGKNNFGQITVPSLRNPKLVSAGFYHTCSLDEDGVKCWGSNAAGQANVPTLRNPKLVSAGTYHTCALDDNGVKCWGLIDDGQTKVPSLENPKLVSAGERHTCALDDNGVKCWGLIDDGQTKVPSLENPKLVSAGGRKTCALDDDGVKCWGYNGYGEANVPSLNDPKFVATGHGHTCSLDNDKVKCWGYNHEGQTNVPSLINPKLVSVGEYHTCAIDDGGVKCWGYNQFGQTDVPNNLVWRQH
jgi:hypothetical protein